jgi:hypothetical protein
MGRKPKGAQNARISPTELENVADKVQIDRQAKQEAKAAAKEARKAAMKKPVIGPQGPGRNKDFGIRGSAAKATSISRSIISRSRGNRGR